MADFSVLTSPDTLLVFASAPAGLGHLRVTKALAAGLPDTVTPVLLGAHDGSLSFTHRIMSISPFSRSIMEWAQNGPQEETFTKIYRNYLRSQSMALKTQILELLSLRMHVVKTLVFVATHFGLAHQLAEIKTQLETQTGIRIILAVQVTDDSPQHMWYVPGADITFVPSQFTKDALERYGKTAGLAPITIETIPYPVSPNLGKDHPMYFSHRGTQLTADAASPIHVAVPISGAAVGTSYIEDLIRSIHAGNGRFVFHVVCKDTTFTHTFLLRLKGEPHIVLHTFKHDRETVDAYETLYETEPISLEITKPSEQAFKSLMPPTSTGGAILLFSLPVGRQEWDNINFMRTHGLIPQKDMEATLYSKAAKAMDLTGLEGQSILTKAETWRGIRIPKSASESAKFILWCHRTGILGHMLKFNRSGIPDMLAHDVQPDGVDEFWTKLTTLIPTVPSQETSKTV